MSGDGLAYAEKSDAMKLPKTAYVSRELYILDSFLFSREAFHSLSINIIDIICTVNQTNVYWLNYGRLISTLYSADLV